MGCMLLSSRPRCLDGQFLWMEPRDLGVHREPEFQDQRRIGAGTGAGWGEPRVVSADGTVRKHTLPDDFDGNKLRAMLTANGGEGEQEYVVGPFIAGAKDGPDRRGCCPAGIVKTVPWRRRN